MNSTPRLESVKQSSTLATIGVAIACGAFLTQTARAGGISLYEIGTPDVGLASAGHACRADDIYTPFTNPTGHAIPGQPSPNIGAACTFLWAGDKSVDQGTDLSLRGRVSGSYNDAWFTIANLNLTYKF